MRDVTVLFIDRFVSFAHSIPIATLEIGRNNFVSELSDDIGMLSNLGRMHTELNR